MGNGRNIAEEQKDNKVEIYKARLAKQLIKDGIVSKKDMLEICEMGFETSITISRSKYIDYHVMAINNQPSELEYAISKSVDGNRYKLLFHSNGDIKILELCTGEYGYEEHTNSYMAYQRFKEILMEKHDPLKETRSPL